MVIVEWTSAITSTRQQPIGLKGAVWGGRNDSGGGDGTKRGAGSPRGSETRCVGRRSGGARNGFSVGDAGKAGGFDSALTAEVASAFGSAVGRAAGFGSGGGAAAGTWATWRSL